MNSSPASGMILWQRIRLIIGCYGLGFIVTYMIVGVALAINIIVNILKEFALAHINLALYISVIVTFILGTLFYKESQNTEEL